MLSNKINNLIWTKKELDKAKAELKNLNTNVAKYLADIQQLKQENKILTNNNQELTMRVEEEIKAKENVITEKNALTAEKENLSKSNAALGTKVDMANAIKKKACSGGMMGQGIACNAFAAGVGSMPSGWRLGG